MNLIICICTYNRNKNLLHCLKSINLLRKVRNITIEVVIVDNSLNYISFKLVKNIKKIFKYKITQLHEKRRGIVYARNKFLKKVTKINPQFVSFIDDDCIVDRNWLANIIKVKKFTRAEVLTGPQISLEKNFKNKNNLVNYSEFFEKKYKKKINKVSWAASNNVFLEYKIIKKHKLEFDRILNKFGIGEDQLFFSKINKYGHSIYWSQNIKVFETVHEHRLNIRWLISRSFRLGVLGHYIDKEIHGKLNGYIISYTKGMSNCCGC